MKTIYAIALSFAFCSICRAQTNFRFADSTAQWNVLNEIMFQGVEWTNVQSIQGDTFINGYYYQMAQSCFGFYRRDSLNRIYSLGDTLIYDFGAQLGDSLHTFWCDGFVKGMYHTKVANVDTVNWGKPRRRLFLTNSQIWVEGIGNINADPLSNLSSLPAHSTGPISLLCFFENGQIEYHKNGYDTCYYSTINLGINESLTEDKDVRVYPNPADDVTTFELLAAGNQNGVLLELTDLSGQVLNAYAFPRNSGQLFTQQLPAGLYLYNLIQHGRRLSSGKLLVQH